MYIFWANLPCGSFFGKDSNTVFILLEDNLSNLSTAPSFNYQKNMLILRQFLITLKKMYLILPHFLVLKI
jgi:hypothetical protein